MQRKCKDRTFQTESQRSLSHVLPTRIIILLSNYYCLAREGRGEGCDAKERDGRLVKVMVGREEKLDYDCFCENVRDEPSTRWCVGCVDLFIASFLCGMNRESRSSIKCKFSSDTKEQKYEDVIPCRLFLLISTLIGL